MIPVTSTEQPILTFTPDSQPQVYRMSAPKIGWLHTQQKPGAEFDLRIKDIRGNVKFERLGIKNTAETYGELANIPSMIGEELLVEVANLRGADKVVVMLN